MIRRWWRLPRLRRRLLVEAVAELLLARIKLLPLPGLDWQRALGERRDVGATAIPDIGRAVARRGVASDVGWAVGTAAARVPWRSVCLPQAIAAQRMLRRRGVHGRAFVGARRSLTERPIDLHVWVLVEGEPIVAGRGHETFEPVVAYEV